CPACNRSSKNDQFPLKGRCVALAPEQAPPGREHPLLLDPGGRRNPACHICFELQTFRFQSVPRWWAKAYRGSAYGAWSIKVFGLNTNEQMELRADHVENFVQPQIAELLRALSSGNRTHVSRGFRYAIGLLSSKLPYTLL